MADKNVVDFPKPADGGPPLLVGPFEEYRVIVDGRIIPRLTGRQSGGTVFLVVDGRFGIDVPEEYARQVAWLVGQAMAVASGYPHLGATSKDMPFAPLGMEVTP